MDLAQDWIKYELIGATAYYGYSRNTSDTSEAKYAIRQVGTTSVSWSNKTTLQYTSVWDHRTRYFSAPLPATWSTAGITVSNITQNTSFGQMNSLNIIWEDLLGVDKYLISVTDSDGVAYNRMHTPAANQLTHRVAEIVYSEGTPSLNYVFRYKPGEVRTVSATWSNVFRDGVYSARPNITSGSGSNVSVSLSISSGVVSSLSVSGGQNYIIGDTIDVNTIQLSPLGSASITNVIQLTVTDIKHYTFSVVASNGYGDLTASCIY